MPEPPRTVYVTHGEPSASEALASRIRSQVDASVAVARRGERVLAD
ncbi:MBL fold metallo-hydrolase RNA specificity domain-containing protein [Ferrimicrobium acidiphilum]